MHNNSIMLMQKIFVLPYNDSNYRNKAYEFFSSNGMRNEILHKN
jgi:hypothetical protein